MFGVRSPLTTPPKFVLTDVKLPRPTPPNPCTDARVSCADAVEATNSVASRIAADEVIRIVNSPHLSRRSVGGGGRWRNRSGQESYPSETVTIVGENRGSLAEPRAAVTRRRQLRAGPSTTI